LLALTVCMFGDILLTSRPVVLSNEQGDLASQFIYWRAFTAEQLRHGHLPLWNPYVYCGMPFLGAAPAGVLYPPTWLDLVLSLPRSINLVTALHVFLAGLFTYLWGLRRGLHPLAAVTAGALFMFSGSFFLHVYAGHLSVSAMPWMPLVFVSLEGWIQNRTRGWILLGTAAIAIQIVSGEIQVCFYTAVAAGLMVAFRMVNTPHRWKVLLGFCAMYAGAAALGALQILLGAHASSESVRSSGLSYEFASMVSFSPENFLTLLAPGFFGDMVTVPYWGRWYLWEMCLFIGVSGLALAVYGAICGKRGTRGVLVSLVVIMLVLALGSNTPLFRVLHRWVFGFNQFRANAKFIIEASLFLTILAGTGLDYLLHSPRGNRWLALGLLIAGIVVGGVAIRLRSAAKATGSTSWWPQSMQKIYATGETYQTASIYTDPPSVMRDGLFASNGLTRAAAEFLILSGLVFLAGVNRRFVYLIALMAIAEIFVFARSTRATFEISSTQAPKLKAFLDQHPGDYRIYYERTPNIAMWLGREDVWGYAQLMLKRYAEFMAFTQGQSPNEATQYLELSRFHPLHAMLRWRYAFLPGTNGDRLLTAKSVMSRLQLVYDYRVLSGRDEILRAMDSPTFDPWQQVILESQPNPAPTPFADSGTATINNSSPGRLTVEADLPHPAILLITDAYSNGWRAQPLADSVQRAYTVLPANYVLQAIPLSQGHHHIQIEYRPAAARVGGWISIAALLGFISIVVYHARKTWFSHPVA